jgi:hypothetical protein
MTVCELWIRGEAENNGHVNVDLIWRPSWDSSVALPTVSISSVSPNGWTYYNDGLGGLFGGAGWYSTPEYYLKNCQSGSYDCVNGQCITKSTYNTPGIFATLVECQAVCTSNGCSAPAANYCPEGKVCIDSSEWSQIEELASQNRAKHCG